MVARTATSSIRIGGEAIGTAGATPAQVPEEHWSFWVPELLSLQTSPSATGPLTEQVPEPLQLSARLH